MASLERIQIGVKKSQELVFATCIYKSLRTLRLLTSIIYCFVWSWPDFIKQIWQAGLNSWVPSRGCLGVTDEGGFVTALPKKFPKSFLGWLEIPRKLSEANKLPGPFIYRKNLKKQNTANKYCTITKEVQIYLKISHSSQAEVTYYSVLNKLLLKKHFHIFLSLGI